MASNIVRLISYIASLDAVPPGGGIQEGLNFLTDPSLANRLNAAKVKANTYIDAILSTHDNPYGDDREKVAGVILERIEQKRLSSLDKRQSNSPNISTKEARSWSEN